MRSISTYQEAVLSGAGRGVHVRVEVKDGGGTWQDLSSFPGYNAFHEATWQEGIDSPHATADITLIREQHSFSVAPLMADSGPNRGFDPSNPYDPLIALHRELRISVALVPADASPVSGDYFIVFHGRVDTVDPGPEDKVTIQARDLGGDIADTFIEKERVYAYADVSGTPISLRIWEPNTDYEVGEYVIPSEARRNVGGAFRFYLIEIAGTSDPTEPTWPTTGTIGIGTAKGEMWGTTSRNVGYPVEQIIQLILNDNGLSAVTLSTPSSPGWNITQYLQQRQSVLEAIRALAMQIGWDIRYKWDGSDFSLTLFAPDRIPSGTAHTFGPGDYSEVRALKQDIAGIRNRVRVWYSDSADLDPTGSPKRHTVIAEDPTSQAIYGLRFMEIAESSSSQIDTSAEAQTMADACLADLKDPQVEHSILLSDGFPFTELGDYYEFSPNDRHYSAALDLAVYHYSHQASEGHLETTLECRGFPASAYALWHKIGARRNPDDVHQEVNFEASDGSELEVSEVPGGVQLEIQMQAERLALGEEFEYHISRTVNFDPDDTTLRTLSKDRILTVTDLVPGATYYAKFVPRTRNATRIVRGHPSNEVTIPAGRANTGHLDLGATTAIVPVNFGFEHNTDPVGPPDHWVMGAGITWSTDVDTDTDPNGGVTLRLKSGGSTTCRTESRAFPVKQSRPYNLDLVYETSGTNGGGAVFRAVVYFWKDVAATVPSGTLASTTFNITNVASTGAPLGFSVYQQTCPADANFVTIALEKSAGASGWQIEVSYIEYQPARISPGAVVAPTLSGTWADSGGTTTPTGYWVDSSRYVHLRGRPTGGVAGAIFTLPTGFRPSYDHRFIVPTGLGNTTITIVAATGVVTSGVVATNVSLEGIYFRLD